MHDILLSRQQFDALIVRLDDIREYLSVLRPKAPITTGCMEGHDITRQYHISKRTLERWRQSGRVPFHKIGNFFYYNTNDILGRIGQPENKAVLPPDESAGLSNREIRDRHRVALLGRRYFKVPP